MVGMLSNILENDKKKIQIVFFSGTGGTARVTSCMENTFKAKGFEVLKVPLDMQEAGYQERPCIDDSVGLLVLVYAVYALDAPVPVYEWVGGINETDGLPAAVISVSGGGEMWPNTACRVGCIWLLERKGCNVFYERMMVMPSNVLIETKEQLAAQLLNVLPAKSEHCVDEILAGIIRRKKTPVTQKLMASFSKLERKETHKIARDFNILDGCTNCGLCVDRCPRKNIEIKDCGPAFGDRCVACLRCIYGCPAKAICFRHLKMIPLKNGFNLDEFEKRMKSTELLPIGKVKAGILFTGLKKYLEDMRF